MFSTAHSLFAFPMKMFQPFPSLLYQKHDFNEDQPKLHHLKKIKPYFCHSLNNLMNQHHTPALARLDSWHTTYTDSVSPTSHQLIICWHFPSLIKGVDSFPEITRFLTCDWSYLSFPQRTRFTSSSHPTPPNHHPTSAYVSSYFLSDQKANLKSQARRRCNGIDIEKFLFLFLKGWDLHCLNLGTMLLALFLPLILKQGTASSSLCFPNRWHSLHPIKKKIIIIKKASRKLDAHFTLKNKQINTVFEGELQLYNQSCRYVLETCSSR